MNYKETLDYLFSQLPIYQRVGKVAYKVDLSNTLLLCELLKHPEKKFKSIHVAGTNGKGSTCHMLASILQESGYKVGLYTSPHLKDFRERIKINGEMISKTEVIDFVAHYRSKFEEIDLSFFEWTVGLAFAFFAKEEVDIAIIETGLGGRLDSTNVICPEVSVITNIGIDHTQFLGSTLGLIAKEKAGIIKKETPVVVGETQKETKEVFLEKAKELDAPICFTDKQDVPVYDTDLMGKYQTKNIKTSLVVLSVLEDLGWRISIENIRKGLSFVTKNTGLLGRWQVLSEQPLVVCDTAHNVDGVKEVINQIDQITFNKLHFVFGAVNDKSIEGILNLLPNNAEYYFCEANIPRALGLEQLVQLGREKGLTGNSYESVSEALRSAKNSALPNDMVFIGGSTFVVAEIL